MKRKLLIASDCFLPRWDGVARFLSEIIPKLSKTFDITVIAPKYPGKFEEIPDVKIIRFEVSKKSYGDYNPPIADKVKIKDEVIKADIVWTQTIGPIGMNTIGFAKKYKKKLVAFIHSIEWELVPNSIKTNFFKVPLNLITVIVARRMYNRCDLLIVPSMETAEILSWQGIRTKKKIVHLGVDIDKFVPAKNKDDAKKKVNIDAKRIVVGFVGRLGREKDLVTLYRAFIRLEGKYKDLKLLIVGTGIDELTELFKKRKGVILAGNTDNVVPYLQAMDIYVLPSLTETSSLTTMEAMSCGLGVIATPVGHIKEYIQHGKNGMLFPKKNVYLLMKRIEHLIENPELRKKMGEKARKTIEANYSWEKTVKEIERILEEI
jgi:glycosyltransferase involved in cell wall biosynthesis